MRSSSPSFAASATPRRPPARRSSGGNLARGEEISITTSVLGVAERPLLRSGARPGDAVYVSGELGYAAVGLRLAGSTKAVDDPLALRALEAYRRPRARIEEGLEAVRGGATAMIDVSDGLSADATHVADESGITIVLDEASVLSLTSKRLCALAQRDALEIALTGGEDYALLAAAPEGANLPSFTRNRSLRGARPPTRCCSRAGESPAP
jgi:thiamine-monophosphate kinase